MKNTGKPSEHLFEAKIAAMGKRACAFRLVDASEITGRTGKVAVSARASPADYVIVMNGMTYLAEVKSTNNATSFPFSMIARAQHAAGTLVTAAESKYLIFIHRVATNQWYMISYNTLLNSEKASITWAELEDYKW